MNDVVQQVRQELITAIQENRIVLPTLPEVALQVRDAAQDPDIDVPKMSKVLAQDAALSARVVRVSNSPLLRGANPITDLKMAISRLGIQYSCNLAVGLAMEQMFQATSEAVDRRMREIWGKSTEIAGICSVLAKMYTKLQGDQATLAGLVCKIGALPILRYAEEERSLLRDHTLLDVLIAELHPEIGRLILETWDFPPELVMVPTEYMRFDRQRDTVDYADVVQVALLQSVIGQDDPLNDLDWSQFGAFHRLGLDPSVNAMEVEDLSEAMAESIAALR